MLLLLDNAPSHPKTLGNENIRVEYMPPNTTSLIQPLDQGIIAAFKKVYLKNSYQKLLKDIEEKNLFIQAAWKNFNILDAVKMVGRAVKQLTESTLKNCWRKLINPTEDETEEDGYTEEVVSIARRFEGEGFSTIEQADILEILQDEPMTLEQALNLLPEEDDVSDGDMEGPEEKWKLKMLRDGFELSNQLLNHFRKADPSAESFALFKKDIDRSLLRYSEVKNKLECDMKQSKISSYFKKPSS